MKGIIKKILKEDMDWVKDVNPIQDYISWLNDLPQWPQYPWQNGFEDVVDVVGYPRMDAETMVRSGRIIEDTEQSIERRLEALDEFETYSQIGTIIENTRLYFTLIVEYSVYSGINEDTVVEMANEIIHQHLHKGK